MVTQKIFGLVVTDQKIPLLEKPEENDQCYICGFRFDTEDCMFILVNKELDDQRKVHAKCIQNHLQLLPKDSKIALVSTENNEVIAYTTASQS